MLNVKFLFDPSKKSSSDIFFISLKYNCTWLFSLLHFLTISEIKYIHILVIINVKTYFYGMIVLNFTDIILYFKFIPFNPASHG